MAISNVPVKETPYLFDKPIGELQQILKDSLPWLDYSFGRAERLVKEVDGKRLYTPNVYTGDEQYEVILPDDRYGCYSFFTLSEPQDVISRMQREVRIRTPFSLVMWVDMRRVEKAINLVDERNTEYVKEQVLSILGAARMHKGSIIVEQVYERAENVFQGFSLDEVQNQFLMSPFAGFRFAGTMITTNDCLL